MYVDALAMTGRIGVVVGAGGGGHGTAITAALVEAGATVIALDVSADALDRLIAEVQPGPGRVLARRVDARASAEVERCLDEVVRELGPIDSLTNVVGGTRAGQWSGLEDCSDDTFDDVLGTNLKIAFVTCRGVARRMIAAGRGGSIVNLSSVSGLVSAPEHGPYGAAKSGLMALSRTMAIEWSPHGIRVNVVAPGAMSVPRLAYLHARQPSVAESIPLGRRGTPFDVAGATLFLHSDLAGYITGQTLTVDGGLTAKTPFGGSVVRRMTVPSEPPA